MPYTSPPHPEIHHIPSQPTLLLAHYEVLSTYSFPETPFGSIHPTYSNIHRWFFSLHISYFINLCLCKIKQTKICCCMLPCRFYIFMCVISEIHLIEKELSNKPLVCRVVVEGLSESAQKFMFFGYWQTLCSITQLKSQSLSIFVFATFGRSQRDGLFETRVKESSREEGETKGLTRMIGYTWWRWLNACSYQLCYV